MMMAHETPDRPQLSAASGEALESALQTFLADESNAANLQPALHRIAAEAREKKMQAEHLLVLLKDVWFALPQVRQIKDIEHQNKLLQRVVTLCIREYYST